MARRVPALSRRAHLADRAPERDRFGLPAALHGAVSVRGADERAGAGVATTQPVAFAI